MDDFQVGDLVECIRDRNFNFEWTPKVGERFIIISICTNTKWIGFKLPRLGDACKKEYIEGKNPRWLASEFILIDRSKASEVLYGN